MREETYEFESDNSMMIFEFISEGPKGKIRKRIHFEETNRPNFYNLAFGDVNEETDDFDDKIVSDNEDTNKVLVTVASTVALFLSIYPDAFVRAKGGNFARTRLYRMGISSHLEAINKNFKVFVLLDDTNWEVYEKNKNYSAYVILKIK
jgi:hypothetical protein